MALATVYLADTSALARLPHPLVASMLEPLILAGQVATCSMIDLEALYSTRSCSDLARTRRRIDAALHRIPMTQGHFDRAIDVMARLARVGQHRAAKLPDLLIAAVAERSGLILLHYDQDFDGIAAITGQPTEWVVPRGSV